MSYRYFGDIMSINKYAGWELQETSEPFEQTWVKGNKVYYTKFVEELWVNPQISGLFAKNKVVTRRQLAGRILVADRNKYTNGGV